MIATTGTAQVLVSALHNTNTHTTHKQRRHENEHHKHDCADCEMQDAWLRTRGPIYDHNMHATAATVPTLRPYLRERSHRKFHASRCVTRTQLKLSDISAPCLGSVSIADCNKGMLHIVLNEGQFIQANKVGMSGGLTEKW